MLCGRICLHWCEFLQENIPAVAYERKQNGLKWHNILCITEDNIKLKTERYGRLDTISALYPRSNGFKLGPETE